MPPETPAKHRDLLGHSDAHPLLREVLGGNCVSAFRCASARASGINFQACSFNHSDITRRTSRQALGAWTLEPSDVPELVELPADRVEDTDGSKAKPLAKGKGCGIWQADTGHDLWTSSRSSAANRSPVERRPTSASTSVGMTVVSGNKRRIRTLFAQTRKAAAGKRR